MSNTQLLTSSQVGTRLGITRQAVVARVHEGTLDAALQLPGENGAFLFEPEVVDAAKGRYER